MEDKLSDGGGTSALMQRSACTSKLHRKMWGSLLTSTDFTSAVGRLPAPARGQPVRRSVRITDGRAIGQRTRRDRRLTTTSMTMTGTYSVDGSAWTMGSGAWTMRLEAARDSFTAGLRHIHTAAVIRVITTGT
jgi:hypothetical protein